MDMTLAVEDQTSFPLDLFKSLTEKSANNAVMSPLSIATALAMAGAGARGETLAQITSVLKLPKGEAMHEFSQVKATLLKDGRDKGGPLLSFANGLWVEKSLTLKPAFREILKKSYGAEVRQADFSRKAEEERTSINSWVLEETKGKIKDLLPPQSINEQTSLVLANALYFKGLWAKQFYKQDTVNHDFHLLDGKTVNVRCMRTKQNRCIHEFDTYKVLKLPYTGGRDHRSFSMYFVLPNEIDGLPEVEKNLDAESLTKHLNWTNREVKVGKFILPKFKISTDFSVPEALRRLGMKAPFSERADFTDMVEGPKASSLSIPEVFHKSFIEVNEKGTEAAAATAAAVQFTSAANVFEEREDFVADHPFLFILKEDATGLVLFIGRITNPSLSC